MAVPVSTAIREIRPSSVFLALLAGSVVLGGLLWNAGEAFGGPTRLQTFGFVVCGWIVTLSLHEFGHAFAAYLGGDRSVVGRGYLTLDPRRYSNPLLSIGLPVLFVLMGGIGLPGGAVWVNRAAIRSPLRRSVMSLAGPFANLLAGVALLGLARALPDNRGVLLSALSFLGRLQIMACVFNLLPMPGFDGFGAIEPFLPRDMAASFWRFAPYSFFIVFALFAYGGGASDRFFDVINRISDALGGDRTSRAAAFGYFQFRFWES
jgi:Zn-dependent protease